VGKVTKVMELDEAGGELGHYTGKVQKVGPKFGFIICEELKGQGYDNIFVVSAQLKGFTADQNVSFTAYLDSQGRCQGKALTKPSKAPKEFDEAGGELGEYTGIIEKIGPKFGFIISDDLKNQGHDNVFVHAVHMQGFKASQKVSFTAYLDSKDRCQGKQLKSLKAAAKLSNVETGSAETTIGNYIGKIEKLGPKFGFITCDGLKQQGYDNVFVKGDQLKGFQADQKVKFTAYVDEQGRCKGKDLKPRN